MDKFTKVLASEYEAPQASVVYYHPEGVLCSSFNEHEGFGTDPEEIL